MTNNHINKNLYKIFLITIKYLPMFLSIIQTLKILMNYLGIKATLLTYIGGMSIPFLIMLFIMSYVFKFCYLYRIPLVYLVLIWSIAVFDKIFIIPVNILYMFRLYAVLFGIFTVLFVWYMYKNRHKPKVDHIKQLCENYTSCCE